MTKLIDQAQTEVLDLAVRVYAEAGKLATQDLDDLKHEAARLKVEDGSPSRRVAAYIVADACEQVQKDRRAT